MLYAVRHAASVYTREGTEPLRDLGLDALRVVVVVPVIGRAPALRRHHQAAPGLSAAGRAGRATCAGGAADPPFVSKSALGGAGSLRPPQLPPLHKRNGEPPARKASSSPLLPPPAGRGPGRGASGPSRANQRASSI